MTDREIIELFFSRSEEAIAETKRSFGALMRSVAGNILPDRRDAEEAVSDACLALWNSVPPERPQNLAAYIGRLTRNASIDKARRNRRMKRGAGEYDAVLDEVGDFISKGDDFTDAVAFREVLERFLDGLPKRRRVMFVQRYWYLLPIKAIAAQQKTTEAAVKTELCRIRLELRELLKKEGYICE